MFLNDQQITTLANQGMLSPFVPHKVKEENGKPIISYGLQPYGYDIRLSENWLTILYPNQQIDPKNSQDITTEHADFHSNDDGEYFVIPPYNYALGVSVEKFTMPDNVSAIVVGKSTYARCGLLVNCTTIDAGWTGFLTIQMANLTDVYMRVYCNEGIAQIHFIEGKPPMQSYGDGKYQNQPKFPTLARM